MNIDGNVDQLTMADCLYLTEVQQALSGSQSQTQAFMDALEAAVAISYNPNHDFYVGTTTPVIDPKDAMSQIVI